MSSHLVQAIVAFPAMVLLSALTFVGAYHVMRVGYGVPRTARFLRGFSLLRSGTIAKKRVAAAALFLATTGPK